MPGLENQRDYWDTVGATKTFTHPVEAGWLRGLNATARLVDYGCGYGRVTGIAEQLGFTNVEGVDTSPNLIARARRNHPRLTFRVLTDPPSLPYPDDGVDAVLLMAVLTCIPTDDGQRTLMTELARVLRPGGLLYVSDLLLQNDGRSLTRYRANVDRYGHYGVFETADGAVCRHHSVEWLLGLLRDRFTVNVTRQLDVETMNSNSARAMQILAARS
uniref:class I SAM-dependent methyltransferase n=1 Tax=Paractinoplanes polyasparticus TaxID=2856853 RepID=UPI001C853B6C|nr:class I SAM-dependent methyltransferase [Actinoplanes polyasparticus]